MLQLTAPRHPCTNLASNMPQMVIVIFVITYFCMVLGSYTKAERHYTGERWSMPEAGLNNALRVKHDGAEGEASKFMHSIAFG
jgi:hypothetical protein